MSSRPNILWICTDQQRFDTILALGNDHAQTPHLDKLIVREPPLIMLIVKAPSVPPVGLLF